jgi:hypothetical protein
MGRRHLDRETLLVTAAGIWPRVVLPASRGPLGECVRCRAVVVRAASGGRRRDAAEEGLRRAFRRRALKALPVAAASLLGLALALAVAATLALDLPFAAPVTRKAPIVFSVAVPAPATYVTQASTPTFLALDRPLEPRPAVREKRRAVKTPVARRARVASASPKPCRVAVVQTD